MILRLESPGLFHDAVVRRDPSAGAAPFVHVHLLEDRAPDLPWERHDVVHLTGLDRQGNTTWVGDAAAMSEVSAGQAALPLSLLC